MDRYTLNSAALHCDEVVSLYLCGIGIHPARHSEASVNLKNSILKLEKSLPRHYHDDLRIAKERFYFDPGIWWKEQKPIEYLDLLRRAVWRLEKIRILYKSESRNYSGLALRTIRPYGLVVKNMDWYIVAFCETKQRIRVFRCDRILKAVPVKDAPYTIPSDFNLEAFWTDWTNQFVSSIKEEHPPSYPVRLQLLDPGLTKLKGYDTVISSPDEHIVSMNLYTYENARSVLSELGSKVKVLEPLELRDCIVREARRVLDIYAVAE